MAMVRRYFTFTPYPNPGDNGRTMTFPWMYLTMYNPSVIVPESAKNTTFYSSVNGDFRYIVYAESDDAQVTMMNDGSTGLIVDCMILEGGGNFNFGPLSEGISGTSVSLANYFSPARVVTNPDNTTITYGAVTWNTTTNMLEQLVS